MMDAMVHRGYVVVCIAITSQDVLGVFGPFPSEQSAKDWVERNIDEKSIIVQYHDLMY